MPQPRKMQVQRAAKTVARIPSKGSRLPPFRQYPIFRQTFEFEGSAGTFNVTSQNLRNLIIIPTSSTTAGVSLFDSTKLIQVEIWANQSSATVTYSDVQLEWTGGSTPGMVAKAAGTAFDPPHLRLSPPKNSIPSFWRSQSDTGNLFTFVTTTNFVIRVTIDYTVCNGAGNAVSGAAATVGTIYYNALAPNVASTAQVNTSTSCWS